MVGSSSGYVTTMISFVTIGIVIVGMFLICHVTSSDHIFERLCEFMVEAPHGKSSPYLVWWLLV